jgi:hypothetical protein
MQAGGVRGTKRRAGALFPRWAGGVLKNSLRYQPLEGYRMSQNQNQNPDQRQGQQQQGNQPGQKPGQQQGGGQKPGQQQSGRPGQGGQEGGAQQGQNR